MRAMSRQAQFVAARNIPPSRGLSRRGEVLIYDTSQPPSRLDSPSPSCDDYAMTNRPLDIAPLDAIYAAISALDAITDDYASLAIRDAIINDPSDSELSALAADYDLRAADIAPILILIRALSRDDLSILALSFSLCPLHLHDYAICFDDDDINCQTIRAIFPSHDS